MYSWSTPSLISLQLKVKVTRPITAKTESVSYLPIGLEEGEY